MPDNTWTLDRDKVSMPRRPRVVLSDVPHHITQRGSRRQRVFFSAEDFETYLAILRPLAARFDVKVGCYCLMPNHVHFIAQASNRSAFARAFGIAHAKYSRETNARYRWQGHLWQERFHSFPMDEPHLLRAARYVLRNPVRAGLVVDSTDWPHSSLAVHRGQKADSFVDRSMFDQIADWVAFLRGPDDEEDLDQLRRHSRSGLPVGSRAFIRELERKTGRHLRPRPIGRPRREKE